MENKKMTTPIVSVGADTEQSPNVCNDSITDFNEDGKSLDDYLEEMQKEFSKQMSPSYLKTVSMSELLLLSFCEDGLLVGYLRLSVGLTEGFHLRLGQGLGLHKVFVDKQCSPCVGGGVACLVGREV